MSELSNIKERVKRKLYTLPPTLLSELRKLKLRTSQIEFCIAYLMTSSWYIAQTVVSGSTNSKSNMRIAMKKKQNKKIQEAIKLLEPYILLKQGSPEWVKQKLIEIIEFSDDEKARLKALEYLMEKRFASDVHIDF